MSASRPVLRLAVPEPADPALGAFHAVLDRLEAVVRRETEGLSGGPPADVQATDRQKRQGLLELSRVMRTLPAEGAPAEVRARLSAFAALLERNQTVLDRQLRAVREVADIVARVMRDAESDGTYTLRTRWQ